MTEKELVKLELNKKDKEEKTATKNKVNSKSDQKISEIIASEEENLEAYQKKIDEIREEMMSTLTDIERDVLNVAIDILKKKKYEPEFKTERIEMMSPVVEMIYSKSRAKFENQKGYKKEAIFQAIQSLEDKKWLITGQRMTKSEILSNPIKKEILSFIEKYPGVHARDERILKYLNITRNPFIKHMASLEAFNLVRAEKIGATLNYFPFDLPSVFDDLAVLFQNEIVVEIVKMYLNNNNITLMDLSEKIGVYHRAIQYHIKALVDHKVLIPIGSEEKQSTSPEEFDSRRKYYKVNEELLSRYNKLFRIPPFVEWMK
jgi:predicted transcriptional regulator